MLSYNSHTYNTSAKLLKVCTGKNEFSSLKLGQRQIPLIMEDGFPTFIIQFDEIMSSLADESKSQEIDLFNLKKNYEKFLHKYESLCEMKSFPPSKSSKDTENVILKPLEAKSTDLINNINKLIPCIGCRTSVERYYTSLIEMDRNKYSILDPFLITKNGDFTLNNQIIFDPLSIFKLFYVNGPKLDTIYDGILKTKKHSRRCHMHSLDSHKRRSTNDWLPVWDALNDDECKQKLLEIDISQLSVTLNGYLNRHKFCSDCKMKVLKAFSILTGDVENDKELVYSPALYEGLECCTNSLNTTTKCKHIHVKNDKKFVVNLISKAEIDIQGNRRETHAKTIEIAQEEVLTCIGIYLFERFHRISKAIRMEEQIWQLLYYISLYTLKKTYELEFEKRQGFSELELICAEILANDERKQLKKERQKQKKHIRKESKCKKCEDANSNSLAMVCVHDLSDSKSLETKTETYSVDNEVEICDMKKSDGLDKFLEGCITGEDKDDYFITDEEKMEYQANKTAYLIQRLNRRELLKQRFQELKLNSIFKLSPRNF